MPDPSLIALYWPDRPTSTRVTPWTWIALTDPDRDALAEFAAHWVDHHNRIYAVAEDQLIPPCWRQHPRLAVELAVMAWMWYSAHHDPTGIVERAGEFYLRHLPGFHSRLPALLGRSPSECGEGQHPPTWRKDTEQKTNNWSRENILDIEHENRELFKTIRFQ